MAVIARLQSGMITALLLFSVARSQLVLVVVSVTSATPASSSLASWCSDECKSGLVAGSRVS